MSGYSFEEQVHKVARAKWPLSAYSGAAMHGGRERDGIYETDETVHIIECTELATKAKAESDCKKLSVLIKTLRPQHSMKSVRGWFITLKEPTAEQRSVAKLYASDVFCCSFAQFKAGLIDSREYLQLRSAYKFGSATDPDDDSLDLSSHPFIAIDFYDVKDQSRLSFASLFTKISQNSDRVLFLGDFGAGKSMTVRELFLKLSVEYQFNRVARFPVHLNLRDHQGQTSTVEALERHARLIGFPTPSDLVKAWRAGFVDLILDGFDEIATSGWTSLNKKLRDIRYANVALVRNFVDETPREVSLILCGRPTYFDSLVEMRHALRTTGMKEYRLGEFTAEQATEFIQKRRLTGSVPDWLPSRPLLLGYLLARKALEADSSLQNTTAAEGWDYLLNKISQRDARVDQNIDGALIRQVIERLSTLARSTGDGLGPFTRDDLAKAFAAVAGYTPQIGSDVVLLRLPGIGNYSEDDGTRSFIDEDIADVARAGDVARYILNPFDSELGPVHAVQSSLGSLGAQVCALQLERQGVNKGGVLRTALEHANAQGRSESSSLPVDILLTAQEMGLDLLGKPILIEDADCDTISFSSDQPSYANVSFSNCLFSQLSLDEDVGMEQLPKFINCYIALLDGRASRKDLPPERFDKTEIEEFTISLGTTFAIMQADLPSGTRVLLSILKKLFLQAGKARQESAFFRGLDQRVRHLVPEVLHLVANDGIATEIRTGGKALWVPSRKDGNRARSMLVSPHTSQDPLFLKSKLLG